MSDTTHSGETEDAVTTGEEDAAQWLSRRLWKRSWKKPFSRPSKRPWSRRSPREIAEAVDDRRGSRPAEPDLVLDATGG